MILPEVSPLMKMLQDNFGNKQLEVMRMLNKSKLMKSAKPLKKVKIFLETELVKLKNRFVLFKENVNTQLTQEFQDTRLKCKR